MIEGELYQLTKTGDATITEEEHFEIIRRKTAYPVLRLRRDRRAARRRAPPEQRTALREYGFNLGIAFQIVDDVLDYMADESRARQADRRRPARRQGHAAGHPAAAADRSRGRRPGPARSSPTARSTPETWRTIKDLLARARRDRRRVRARGRLRRPRQAASARRVSALDRTRRPRRARRLRPQSRPLETVRPQVVPASRRRS